MRILTRVKDDGIKVVEKIAESPSDETSLINISLNLQFCNNAFSFTTPKLLQNNQRSIELEYVNGSCLSSEEAAFSYRSNPWITSEIKKVLFEISNVSCNEPAEYSEIKNNFVSETTRLVLNAIKNRCYIPTFVIANIVRMVCLNKTKFIYSHGDFTTSNIVINRANKQIAVIDWESLGKRPKNYDLFYLILNSYSGVSTIGSWEEGIIHQYHEAKQQFDQSDYDLFCYLLFKYYFLDQYRYNNYSTKKVQSKYPGIKSNVFEFRARQRLLRLKKYKQISRHILNYPDHNA